MEFSYHVYCTYGLWYITEYMIIASLAYRTVHMSMQSHLEGMTFLSNALNLAGKLDIFSMLFVVVVVVVVVMDSCGF